MQRLKFIDFMVIELCFFKKKKMKNMDKSGNHFFRHITSQHNQFLYFYINFKLKVKMNKILIYGFQWG